MAKEFFMMRILVIMIEKNLYNTLSKILGLSMQTVTNSHHTVRLNLSMAFETNIGNTTNNYTYMATQLTTYETADFIWVETYKTKYMNDLISCIPLPI